MVKSKTTKWWFGMPIGRLLFLASFAALLFGGAGAVVWPSSTASADAYSSMSPILPDDSYKLISPETNDASTDDCLKYESAPTYHWGCTAGSAAYFNGSDSHQYITMSNDSINDDRHPSGATYFGQTVEFEIFTTSPGGKNLSINTVDRGIGTAKACNNTVTAYYYKGSGVTRVGSPSTITSSHGCGNYSFNDFPGSAFDEVVDSNGPTGIWKGRFVLVYDSANSSGSQISFHISTSGARLGYAGADSIKLPESNNSEHGYVNTYPTNLAKGNTIRYYFRPACTVPEGTPFGIAWDDVNNGTPYQPSDATGTLYKFHPGDIGSRQIVGSLGVLDGAQARTFSTDNYGQGNKQPFAYMVQFDNVYGGNGISFRHPFSSADARVECPPPKPLPNSWGVDMAANCSQLTGHIVKYNSSGNATSSSNGYVLQHWNRATSKWDTIGFGSTNGGDNSFSASIDGSGIFGDGSFEQAFQVINGNAGSYGRLPSDGFGVKIRNNCLEHPTIVQFTATCHSVTFTILSDGDSPGSMSVAINAYDRTNGSRAYSRLYNVKQGDTVEFNQPPDRQNAGVDVYAGAYAWHVPGNPSDDYQAGTTPIGVEVYSIPSCYSATCSITTTSPGLPDGYVEEGKPFSIKATLYNTGGFDKNPLYSNLDGTPLTITPDFGNMKDNALVGFNGPEWMYDNAFAGGQSIPIGGSHTRIVGNYTAPNRFGVLTLRGYADYYSRFAIGQSDTDRSVAPCEATNVRIMQHFHLYPHATVNGDSVEDPSAINYNNYLTLKNLSNPTSPSTSINGPGESSFYKRPVGSLAKQYKAGPVYPGGTYNDGDNTVMFSTSPYVPDDFEAGDKYCSDMGTDVANGFNDGFVGERGPDDIVGKTNVNPLDTNCLTVKNDATFKVLGNDLSAGGDFAASSGGACSGGGQLGGWFNNMNYAADGSGYTFGSGTQLSALALIKTTGVASAQTSEGRSPTELSFANNRPVDKTPSPETYSPGLGGNFGFGSAAPSHCLATVSPPAGATALPTGNVSGLNGAYTANGNQTLTGGSIGPNQHISIFVNGDVYIANNITYSTGGWDKDHIPSFILSTNGNIYIAPGVTQLDGMYIAQPRVDGANPDQLVAGSAGTIYTCGTAGYAPVTGGDVHDTCKNQLTVHGIFVADHVNLMRTYGTLRDEKPLVTPAGAQLGIVWRTHDAVPGMNCVNTAEPWDPGDSWGDDYVCIPASTGIQLGWTCNASSSFTKATAPAPCHRSLADLKTEFPNCTQWSVPQDPDTWADDWLCWTGTDSNLLKFSLTNDVTKYCTIISEPADSEWPAQAYLCEQKAATGGVLPPSSLDCSNAGTTSFTRRLGYTCAAEVFDFSPEMYLSTYALDPPGKGALQFDAITSLPPVL